MTWLIVLILAILSGIFGRMGGSDTYNGKWRDVGCSLIVLIVLWLLVGFKFSLWWAYLLIFGFSWGAFSLYWDELFGFDNFWFSGFMSGLAIFPMFWAGISWWLILIQAIILAVIWGCIQFIQGNVLIWRNDVVKEFLRYSLRIAILPLLLI